MGIVENKAQLLTSLNGQFLSKGFLRDTFRNASMPLDSPNADDKVPVEESGERQRHRSNPDAETTFAVGREKSKNFLGSQSKHRSLV